MRYILFILFSCLQLLLAPSLLRSQGSYPIYVSPALLPPYSLNLSDYSAIGSQRLMLTIVVNDLDVANLPVKLRIKMETAGVTIETPLTINTIPVYLDGGSATVLFGEDLIDYFNINNLQFKGYSKEAYQRSGQLPEGFYRFSVEVLHFHTNRVISNTGTVSAWIALGKPPVLRSPSNDAELGQYMGVPVTFSWLASNVGSPVSAGSIRYKFELWEQRVKGVNPYNIVSSMPVFHEHTGSSAHYSLNPASLMMEEGMSYVWRVTAFDESGLVPFAQNGHSEVRTFTYKAHCAGIEAISTLAVGQKGSFTWTPDKHHSSYNVEVRNTAKDIFISGETFDSKVEYYDLERGQTYELRVQAVCNGDPFSVSDYSEWAALTIPEAKPKDNNEECPECECRDELPKVELTNFELRQDLSVGDTLSNRTGTTRFIVKSVKPEGNNSYSGIFYFWAEIWGIKIPCTYTGLQVNTDNVIVNMNYKSINDPKFLANIDALLEGGNEFLDNLAAATARTAIRDTIVVSEAFDYIIERDGRLMAVVIDENGEPKTIPLNITVKEAQQALITNEEGDRVVISAKGEAMGVKEFQATGGNSRLMNSYKEEKEREDLTGGTMLNFSAHKNQKYGFDAYTPQKINIQNSYPILGKDYRPAFKSIESFSFDRVMLNPNPQPETPNSKPETRNSSTPNSKPETQNILTFRDEAGIPAHVSGTEVTVRGAAAGSNRALYAYRALTDSTEEIVGKLNLLSFDKTLNRVHIIAVNGAKTPSQLELEQSLNNIYRQAIAGWTVISEPGVSVSFEGGRMTHEGAGSFSTYNADQGAIVAAFEATGRRIERKDFYLFFVDGATFKDRSLAGYMPLQRQVGFIYDNPSVEIIAHELGHGAFNLRHPFSPEAFIATEGSTRNLMDYANGTELWLHQWHSVQNPSRILFAWAQDESEGAMMAASDECWEKGKENWNRVTPQKYKAKTKLEYSSECGYFYSGNLRRSYFGLTDGNILIVDQVYRNNTYSSDPDALIDVYHLYIAGLNEWFEVDINTFEDDCLSCDLNYIAAEVTKLVGKTVGRYILPIEDIYILIEGEDFDRVQSSRAVASGFLLIEFIPGGKVLKPITKGFKSATKATVKGSRKIYTLVRGSKVVVGEFADDVLKPVKWIDGEVDEIIDIVQDVTYATVDGSQVKGTLQVVKKGDDVGFRLAKFTTKEVDNFVKTATKNPEAKKVMLGSWDDGLPTSYIQRAGKDHTFFDMGSRWDEVKRFVDNGIDDSWKVEMWKINKQFIDEQKSLGKEFLFSHEPWLAQTKTFLSKEAEYLIDLGATDFLKINDNTWKVIW